MWHLFAPVITNAMAEFLSHHFIKESIEKHFRYNWNIVESGIKYHNPLEKHLPPSKLISDRSISLFTKHVKSLLKVVNIRPPWWHLVNLSNGTTMTEGRSVNLSADDIGAVCIVPSWPRPKSMTDINVFVCQTK